MRFTTQRVKNVKIAKCWTKFALNFGIRSGAKVCTSCRYRGELSNECFLANYLSAAMQPRTSRSKIQVNSRLSVREFACIECNKIGFTCIWPTKSETARKSFTTGVGMMKPKPSAPFRPEKATPTTSPVPLLKTGPPELPGLIAASICTVSCFLCLLNFIPTCWNLNFLDYQLSTANFLRFLNENYWIFKKMFETS